MSERRHPIPQMDELSDGFRALGQREAARQRPFWRRWLRSRRQAVGLGVAAVALVGTAAGATQWISLGEPENPPHPDAPRYQPGAGTPVIAVTAPDSAVGLPWGVAVFDSRSGENCAFSGQVRGSKVGIVRDGRFRPFAGPTSAVCMKLSDDRIVWTLRMFDTTPRRMIAFGRAGAGVAKVRLNVDRTARVTTLGQGGAFLFVLDGSVRPDQVSAQPLDAEGRNPGQAP